MKSAFEELFQGLCCCWDHIRPTEKCEQYLAIAADQREIVEGLLPEGKKEELDKLCDALDGMSAEDAEQYYTEGMKLGIRLGMEINK